MQKNNIFKFTIFIIFSILLVFLDQITKFVAKNTFINNPKVLIKNVLEFSYTENTGAAFGVLKNQFAFFYIITILVILFILFFVYKTDFSSKYLPIIFSILLIFSGSIGNLIDRIKNNYVIDFIYFKIIDFPLFNLADTYITIGASLIIILFLFFYKEEDFNYVFKSK